jgi:hypothetical protein
MLSDCPQLDHLKISERLCKLSHLDIRLCQLNTVEIRAQNLVTFNYCGGSQFNTILCEGALLKNAHFVLDTGDAADYAFSKLAPLMPNLQTLYLVGSTKVCGLELLL